MSSKGAVFEGAVFVSLTAAGDRSCHCPCIALGHHGTCQGRIPTGGEFHLALIEREVELLMHLGAVRSRYRDQIAVCCACAIAIKASEHRVR